MAEQILIKVTRSADQKSITVTDTTDWSIVTGTIDSLTDIILNFYTNDLETPSDSYTMTSEEEDEYTANGTISLTFLTMFSTEFIADDWYQVQMSATSGDYISNYYGFGVFISIKNTVYENIDDLYTPDRDKGHMESLYFQYMALNGLDWLDISEAANRQIKFERRLESLQKLNA